MRKTIYLVGNERLIRASSQAAAKAFTVRDLSAVVATKADLEQFLIAGVKIEEADSKE